ncbi:hypothetical protein ACHAXT_007430 [Thalassiosira profunda]
MRRTHSLALLLGLVAAADATPSLSAFAVPTRNMHRRTLAPRSSLQMALPSKSRATVAEIEAESAQLRKEIEELREEALRRLEELERQLASTSTSTASSSPAETTANTAASTEEEGLLPPPAPIVFTDNNASHKKKPPKSIANLLDETRWKVNLSIGREPGTWMPKQWGASGQRLNLSFVAEFAPAQLYERDDFLRGGYANAKVLHVVDNEVRLGPSLSEGERIYKAKDGGWQVTRGDGPLGTDLLRFYIEVEERIEHTGGDVYLPKGRVYSSCGYFPFLGGENAPSVKEAFVKEMENIEEQIAALQLKKDAIQNPFNLEGFKLGREIFRLNREAERVNNRLNFMAVREPDKNLLRFSKDGDVGVTKEGGVCCQVNKGPVVEYHILGRFGIASAEHD